MGNKKGFYIKSAEIADRHICKNEINSKHEEIVVTIELMGSDDTRGFSSAYLLKIIMDRLELIEQPKKQSDEKM